MCIRDRNKTTASILFKSFDKDKNQYLHGKEITAFCSKFVEGINERLVRHFIFMVDSSGEGKLTPGDIQKAVSLVPGETPVLCRLPDLRCEHGEDTLSIEDFVTRLAARLVELDTDLEAVFRDTDTNLSGYLTEKELSKLMKQTIPSLKFPAAKAELRYVLEHMSSDLRYVRNTPEGGVPQIEYGNLAKAVLRQGGATHPQLAAMSPPRPQPPPVMTLYVPST